MNIETKTTSSQVNELANLVASQGSFSAQQSSSTGFKEQLKSLSSETKTENSENTKTENKTSDNNSDVKEKQESKAQKTENKKEVNSEKTENVQDANVEKSSQETPQALKNQDVNSLSQELQAYIQAKGISLNTLNSVNMLNSENKLYSGIQNSVYTGAPAIDYQSIAMEDGDALFFADLVKNTNMSMNSIASEFQKNLEAGSIQNTQKTAKVSATLMNALSESSKTNQPFRIDFGKDVSVVLRVDKDGNLNANFIPGDKAVEAYLKNNISFLKQRFDEQNLPYNELTYSKHRNQNQEEQRRNNKENNNE